MALLRIIFVTLAILGITVSETLATDYIVGDKKGWTLNVDYQAWAKTKQFRVGDKLIFKYPAGAHNVVKADKDSFQACVAPANAEKLTTGNDIIELKKTGTQLFLCGIGKHCELGNMKFSINVGAKIASNSASVESLTSAPASAPANGPSY